MWKNVFLCVSRPRTIRVGPWRVQVLLGGERGCVPRRHSPHLLHRQSILGQDRQAQRGKRKEKLVLHE